MATPSGSPSPVQWILLILNAGLAGLAVVNPADALVIGAFTKIVQTAMAAYEANTGAPIDLTKIPVETKVP